MKTLDNKSDLDAVLKSAPKCEETVAAINIPVAVKVDLHDFGRQKARASGETRVNEIQLGALLDHAEAMAREQGATIFDPQASRADQIKKDDYERALAKVGMIEAKTDTQSEEVRRRRDAVAELGPPPERPRTPWLLLVLGMVVIGMSVGATLDGYIFYDIESEVTAWTLSMLGGCAVGAFLGFSLVGKHRSSISSGLVHVLALVGGLAIGIALLLVRCAGAETLSGWIMGLGLAALELGAVLVFEGAGRSLSQARVDYNTKDGEHQRRDALLKAAEAELSHLDEEKASIRKMMDEFSAHVAEREFRAAHVEHLVEAARQAVRDGYLAGIAKNEAMLLYGNESGVNSDEKSDSTEE